jgi:hypothetical protein
MTPAEIANEQTYLIGHDVDAAFELADYEAEQEAEAERLEREGRRDMYDALGLGEWQG